MTALAETETADVMAAAFTGIGDKGYQGSGVITPSHASVVEQERAPVKCVRLLHSLAKTWASAEQKVNVRGHTNRSHG